jgi:putative nucleotidyltransferase with HDIG domain
MQTENADRIVQTIEHIPTLPIISRKIHGLLEDDNVSIKKLEQIIQADPPLAAKIMKIVNSSFYGMLSKVSTIDHAVVILGLDELKNIVLSFSIHDFFKEGNELIDRRMFWKHSVICSQVAKFLAGYFNIAKNNTFLLSGLIHDIGKIVIDKYLHEDFISIIDYISTKGCTFSKAEKEILGRTHYQIAAKLLQQWQFPPEVVMQIFYHHAPWHDDNYTTGSTILYLANMLTKIVGYPCFKDEKQAEISDIINPAMLSYLNKNGFEIDGASFERLLQRINDHISNESSNVLSIFE